MNRSEMDFSNVALVGVGQLGSRYLQGLSKCSVMLRIWVVDPNPASLSLAQQRWIEGRGDATAHQISFSPVAACVPEELDLAIIATSANIRESVVRDLSNRSTVKYWVLEKVLSQSTSSLDELLKITASAAGSWVNTPRRMMSWHKELQTLFSSHGPLRVTVGDGLWGLACNAIHFIDLVAWWTLSDVTAVTPENLDPAWIESKRPGFFEVTGALEVTYADGSTLLLQSYPQGQNMTIHIETSLGLWAIDEVAGVARGAHGRTISGRMELQSEMSARLVDSIILSGRCDLPTLENSARLHRPFLNAMLFHWNQSGARNQTSVPLT